MSELAEVSVGLRALADWFDRQPRDLPGSFYGGVTLFVSADELPAVAKAIGTADKQVDDWTFKLVRDFGGGISLRTWTSRDAVCEQVKVGTRRVTRHVVPEGVELTEVTETEDVYEWRCPESILRGELGGDAIPTDDELDARAEAIR